MTSSRPSTSRRLDPNEVQTRGYFVNEMLGRLHHDLDMALAFLKRNPDFGAEVFVLRKAIQVLHDVYQFEEFMPNTNFYKQEIESAHRTIHVDRDGPIPSNSPIPKVGGSRNARATDSKRRK